MSPKYKTVSLSKVWHWSINTECVSVNIVPMEITNLSTEYCVWATKGVTKSFNPGVGIL